MHCISSFHQLTGSSEQPLMVTQFHFTAWPDYGVPDYASPILAFHKRVIREHRSEKEPIMVHCRSDHSHSIRVQCHGVQILSLSLSDGVGRTGIFITIDHVLEQVKKESVVDIPGVINRIRQQRMKLVQTVVSVWGLGVHVGVVWG